MNRRNSKSPSELERERERVITHGDDPEAIILMFGVLVVSANAIILA